MIISAGTGQAIGNTILFFMGMVVGWIFFQQSDANTSKKPVKRVDNTWLDVVLDGKMVEINAKGKTRRKKHV